MPATRIAIAATQAIKNIIVRVDLPSLPPAAGCPARLIPGTKATTEISPLIPAIVSEGQSSSGLSQVSKTVEMIASTIQANDTRQSTPANRPRIVWWGLGCGEGITV